MAEEQRPVVRTRGTALLRGSGASISDIAIPRIGRRCGRRRADTIPTRGNHVELDHSNPGVEEGERAGAERSGAVGRGFEDSERSRESQPKASARSDDSQEADHVSGCPQTNRCCPACTLGEMEGGQAEQMKDNNGQETLRFSALRVSIPSKVWAVTSAAAYDGNRGGNFDYQARGTPEWLPAGTSP